MRRAITSTLAALMIVAAAAFINVLGAQAQDKGKGEGKADQQCHLNTIKGSYGYLNTGTAFGTSLASVGVMTFDGAGNITGNDTNSFGGSISSSAFTGSYTVNANCAGTLTVNFGFFTINNSMVIVDNGREINLIETNAGTVATGVMKRQ